MPDGGVVQVAGDISATIERLLADAAEAGYPMCGYGYRDPAEQIAVRTLQLRHVHLRHLPGAVVGLLAAHRPTGHVDARAGPRHRLHVGSGGTIGSGSGGYRWLKNNGANYGMYNLPGEPWHWSVDGN